MLKEFIITRNFGNVLQGEAIYTYPNASYDFEIKAKLPEELVYEIKEKIVEYFETTLPDLQSQTRNRGAK